MCQPNAYILHESINIQSFNEKLHYDPLQSFMYSSVWNYISRPRENGHRFTDDFFIFILLMEIMVSIFKFHRKSLSIVWVIQTNIGLDTGLAPIRQQAITWTIHGLVYWHIYRPNDLNGFMVMSIRGGCRHGTYCCILFGFVCMFLSFIYLLLMISPMTSDVKSALHKFPFYLDEQRRN